MNDMIDFENIAKKYAEEHKCNIVQPSIKRNGYMYFHIDYTGRARYTGHPHIIKISSTGKVQRVLNVHEIYWAYNLRTIKNGESV